MNREQQLQQVLTELDLPESVLIRAWQETDYPVVRDLALAEGWTTLAERPEQGRHAWRQAWPALVALAGPSVIGFLRALTDEAITLYVADFLVVPEWRGRGIGTSLLQICQLLYPTVRFDLLSTESAHGFYQALGFRPFQGFRKSYM